VQFLKLWKIFRRGTKVRLEVKNSTFLRHRLVGIDIMRKLYRGWIARSQQAVLSWPIETVIRFKCITIRENHTKACTHKRQKNDT